MDSEPKKAKFWQDMDEVDNVYDWLDAMIDMILMDEKHKNDAIDLERGNYIDLDSDDEDGIELWEISREREERCGRA
jgi:hypothetical protein